MDKGDKNRSSGYFELVVNDKDDYTCFKVKNLNMGSSSRIILGKRPDGTWEEFKWLISQAEAHIEKKALILENPVLKKLVKGLKSAPIRTMGTRFKVDVDNGSKHNK